MNFLNDEGRSGVVLGRPIGQARRFLAPVVAFALSILAFLPAPASAIPAFARKYGTSCVTCHTIYPKLNPFGEAFRRNGFRFPGTDSDTIKQEPLQLGAEAYKNVFPAAVWPGSIAGSVPLAFGVNGSLTFHPTSGSAGAVADGGAPVVFDHMVEEAHVWAGGSFSDTITYFAELTVDSGGIGIEHALLIFNDLIGPAHAVNLTVGSFVPTLSSFAPHSSYLADTRMTGAGVTALFGGAPGADSSWATLNNSNGFEVTGVLGGRFDYSVGVNQGTNAFTRAPDNVYGHIGGKFGGVRLDGEEGSSVLDPMKPWAEVALTLDLYGFHSSSRYTSDPTSVPFSLDTANVAGGTLRGQLNSLELDAGISLEWHDNVDGAGQKVQVTQEFAELSYVVFPWLVPAVRFENTSLAPDGGTSVSDLRIRPGIAALVLPNLKLSLVGDIEHSDGAPPGGWGALGGMGGMATSAVSADIQGITLGIAYAY